MPFPRILGIEAVGIVVDAPGAEFAKGDTVATAMGGMGRQFDGGYAEYTVVPATQVQAGIRLLANPKKDPVVFSLPKHDEHSVVVSAQGVVGPKRKLRCCAGD